MARRNSWRTAHGNGQGGIALVNVFSSLIIWVPLIIIRFFINSSRKYESCERPIYYSEIFLFSTHYRLPTPYFSVCGRSRASAIVFVWRVFAVLNMMTFWAQNSEILWGEMTRKLLDDIYLEHPLRHTLLNESIQKIPEYFHGADQQKFRSRSWFSFYGAQDSVTIGSRFHVFSETLRFR